MFTPPIRNYMYELLRKIIQEKSQKRNIGKSIGEDLGDEAAQDPGGKRRNESIALDPTIKGIAYFIYYFQKRILAYATATAVKYDICSANLLHLHISISSQLPTTPILFS